MVLKFINADTVADQIDPAARAVLVVDLEAIRANYRHLRSMNAPGDCSAVVKANAYGLGLGPVAKALSAEGCTNFFVATLDEARALRQHLPGAVIYVLDGCYNGNEATLVEDGLRPVLGSLEDIESWADYCAQTGRKHACAIHIDTGMNRLGLSPAEVPKLAARKDLFEQIDFALVMTHLVSGEIRDDPLTRRQADLFDQLRALLPPAPTSFGNSAGTLLADAFPCDLARPGVALYGAQVFDDVPNAMRPVVTLLARVLKIREIDTGETIGYNATWRAPKPMRVATLALGYADGMLRSLSATNKHPGLPVWFGNQPAPLLGRVSMDYIGVDVTNVCAPTLTQTAFAEVLGSHVTIDDMAKRAQTNAYEILTSLSRRAQRIYLGGTSQQ